MIGLNAIQYLADWGDITNSNDHRSLDRVRADLIEADVDIAFGLIDDAREEFQGGNVEFARRALFEAGKVLADIEARLSQLDDKQRAPFGPLVDELLESFRAAEDDCH